MQCAYVYKKRALKNQQCSIRPNKGLRYCHKHKKFNIANNTENVESNEIQENNEIQEQPKVEPKYRNS